MFGARNVPAEEYEHYGHLHRQGMFGERNVPAEALGDVTAVVFRIAGRIVSEKKHE